MPTDIGYRGSDQQPTFGDVLRPLTTPTSIDYARIDSLQNGPLFQQGRNLLINDQGINAPEYKAALGNVDTQGNLLYNKLTSTASANAARRGMTGSSIEQFGLSEAGRQAGQATLDARNAILLQAAQQASQARSLAAQSLFGQGQTALSGEYNLAGLVPSLNAQKASTTAQLTSDELTSLRNMYLGNQATKLGYENVAQADRASQRANDPFNLLIGGVGAGIPAGLAARF